MPRETKEIAECRKLLAEQDAKDEPTYSYYRDMKNPSKQTIEHLDKWIARTIPTGEKRAVRKTILDFVRQHPDLIERGYSWPEIRNLAEREKNPTGMSRKADVALYRNLLKRPITTENLGRIRSLGLELGYGSIKINTDIDAMFKRQEREHSKVLRGKNPTGKAQFTRDYNEAIKEARACAANDDAKGYQAALMRVTRFASYIGKTKTQIANDLNKGKRKLHNPRVVGMTKARVAELFRYLDKHGERALIQKYGDSEIGSTTNAPLNSIIGYWAVTNKPINEVIEQFWAHYAKGRRFLVRSKHFNKKLRNAPIDSAAGFKQYTNKKLTDLARLFQGAANGTDKAVMISDYAPKSTYRLGHLAQMTIRRNGVRVPVNFDGESFLVADRRNNLWVAGKDARIKGVPNGLPRKGTMKLLGDLVQVDYVTAKQHIENGKTVRFWHPLGEVTNEYPKLFVDHNGFPIIQGGAYEIWNVGIVN